MAKKKGKAPSLSPAGREQYMVSIAEKLAEEQILDGTASSQVLSHYLKLGTKREELERAHIEYKNELLKAKADVIQQNNETQSLYKEAMQMFKRYQGGGDSEDEDV